MIFSVLNYSLLAATMGWRKKCSAEKAEAGVRDAKEATTRETKRGAGKTGQ